MRLLSLALVFAALGPCFAAPLLAQCEPVWLPGDPLPTPLGSAAALAAFDPDGAGPGPSQLLAGGSFAVGTQFGNRIAGFDGSQWLPAGTGAPAEPVRTFAIFQGQLVAASGGNGGSRLLAWNGTSWQVLGACTGFVEAMTVYNGELVVGGNLTAVGSQPVAGLARWNGTTWAPLGSGVLGTVRALAVFNNLLHVGGALVQAGGAPVANYALWNGSSWAAGPPCNGAIEVFATRIGTATTNTWLFAGGAFTQIAGIVTAERVARINQAANTWTAMPGLPGQRCTALFVRSTGLSTFEVTAGVDDPAAAQKAWRWNGSSWTALGSFADLAAVPASFAYYAGQYHVALRTTAARTPCVQRYDGSDWQPLAGPGLDGPVHAVSHGQGEVVVGGAFRRAGSVACDRIARLANGVWSPLGSGLDGPVHAMARLPNGDLLVGGEFTTAGGVPANNIARWLANGNGWTNLGSGTNGPVRAILVLRSGAVIVGGDFAQAGGATVLRVAQWTGVWSHLGQGTNLGFNHSVRALAELPDGTFVAAGLFTGTGTPIAGAPMNHVSRWQTGRWEAMGTGLDGPVHALATMPDGTLVAGGEFLTAGGATLRRLGRWDGTAWQPITFFLSDLNATVRCLAPMPDGSLLAGGDTFSFSLSPLPGGWSANLVRVTGSSVAPLPIADQRVLAVARATDGDLAVGGDFLAVQGLVSTNFAQRETPCPAQATVVGAGCQGLLGPMQLTAQSLPWVGATYRAEGRLFPANSLAFDLVGFAPQATPLALLHPAGGPGCTLLVAPLSSMLLLPTGTRVATQIAFPRDPGLVGVVLYEQLLSLEFDAVGITRLAATNALQLTVGID